MLSIACHLGLALALGSRLSLLGPDGGESPIAVALVEPRGGAEGATERAAAAAAAPRPIPPAPVSPRPAPAAPPARTHADHAPSDESKARRPELAPASAASSMAGEGADRERSAAADAGAATGDSPGARTADAGDPAERTAAATSGGGPPAAGFARPSGADGLRLWCRECPVPAYPARARRRGWQGTVDVELRVGRDGRVEHAHVGRSSGVDSLDAAALSGARRSRFWVPDDEGAGLAGQLRYRFVLEDAPGRRPL